jgi:hypothetical protein
MKLNSRDMELIEKGTRALINELGYAGFLKYISRVQICKGGYLREQEVVYRDIAADKEYHK